MGPTRDDRRYHSTGNDPRDQRSGNDEDRIDDTGGVAADELACVADDVAGGGDG